MEYAGSSFLGANPGGGRRPGVEYSDDEELQRWAEEQGKIKKRGGATTFKIADPSAPGGYRYTLRSADEYSGPGGAGTEASINEDGKDIMAEAMGQTKRYQPRLTKEQAISFKPDYERFRAKSEADTAEARKIALAKEMLAEQARIKREAEDAAEQRRIAAARADRELARELPTSAEKAQSAQADLFIAQTGEAKSAVDRLSESRYKDKDIAGMALMKDDVPGFSKNAEEAVRQSYGANADPSAAVEAGRKQHAADVAELERLETSGITEAIAKASEMRKDSDLAGVKSFLPIRSGERERMAADTAVATDFGDLTANEGIENESALTSFLKAPISGIPRYLSTTSDIQAAKPKLLTAVQKLMTDSPGMTRREAAQLMSQALVDRGVPPERVARVMSGI
jgi:hypothetical protein